MSEIAAFSGLVYYSRLMPFCVCG